MDVVVEDWRDVSDEARHLFEIVNLVVISTAIALAGIVANVINIIIFYRQGLRTTVNIGFTALAVSDLLSLVTHEWYFLCFNPLFVSSGLDIVPSEVQHLTAGFPHTCFKLTTAWIAVYITFERCLCITSPLKVKRILTPRRTKLVVWVIYCVMLLSLLPEYSTAYLDWKFYPDANRTLLGLAFTADRAKIEGVSFMLYGIYMLIAFPILIVCSLILTTKLNHSSKWRQENSSLGKCLVKEKRTLRMVGVMSLVFIVTFTPAVSICTSVFVEPEFSVVGRLRNLFFVVSSFGCVCDATNSSVPILSYYTMSSRYREQFRALF
ncbi:unnamed protein product, partial [Lymnaea stagnalis]